MSFPRYPEYKDSGVAWLGEVPGHWEVCALKRLLEIQNGSDHKHIEQAAGYPVIGSGGQFAYASDYLYDGESVLLGRKGTIDKPLYVTGKFWTVDTMYWSKIAPDACGRYAYYTALTIPFGYYSTNTALPSMTQGTLSAHIVARPPLAEQTAIATFLDRETAKIDALVAEQEKLIALLQENRQAVISHAVTKGLDPNVPMKDSGVEWLGEVPAHWDVSPLKFLAHVGNGSTPNRDNPRYWAEDGFPWLNSSVVNQSEVSEAERFVTQIALKECHLPIVEPPAVLVGITGQGKTRGMAAPLTFTATVNQHLAYIKPDQDRLGVYFLLRVLEAAYIHLRTESEGVGSTKGAITCEQLGAWRMPTPSLEEQTDIASFLDRETAKLDTLMAESRAAITLLQERRTALISAAVTGQIKVTME